LSSLPDSVDRRLCESILQRLLSLRPKVEFPLKDAKSLDGIIAYHTQTHGGTVQDKGIVTIASVLQTQMLMIPTYAGRNVADRTAVSHFYSTNEPGQWTLLGFPRNARPCDPLQTSSWILKSWVVENSLDFMNCTEIDGETDNDGMKNPPWRASCAISNSKSEEVHIDGRTLRDIERLTRKAKLRLILM
jgi:hypothetical protein